MDSVCDVATGQCVPVPRDPVADIVADPLLAPVLARYASLDRARGEASMALARSSTPDLDAWNDEIEALNTSARTDFAMLAQDASGIVWRAATLAEFACGGGGRETARHLLSEVPLDDVLWGLFPAAFGAVVGFSDVPVATDAFVRTNPCANAVAHFLRKELLAAEEEGDAARLREVVELLREPRFSGTGAASIARRHDTSAVLQTGKPMPPFSFAPNGAEATPVTNAVFAGTPYLVDVWATWCVPCRALQPRLEELFVRHGERVAFLGVSVDEVPPAKPTPWKQAHATREAMTAWVGEPSLPIPTLVLVDRDGIIVATGADIDEPTLARVAGA